ncbi:MAG: cytochrome b [Hyphomonadaceae bacterium]|nr:MAG: cytochrome b561 [Caulobacteraceae bacterium]MBT9444433.1 cytochrome b [Hyphomonadaceae bacterium]TPW03029.1 MAG: cytochrome b561 [Alphaproteobacteria bacterium]
MQLANTKAGYGWASVALHWLAAIAIVAMFLIGEQFEDLPRGPEKTALMSLHIGLGVLVAPLLLARVAARFVQVKPEPLPQHRLLALLSTAAHVGLALAIVVLVISGPLTVLSGGRALNVFGWFQIPSPMARNQELHEIAETVHVVTVKVMFALVVVHVLGVVKHLVLDRDKTLLRMLRPE